MNIIDTDLVLLDADAGEDKHAVIRSLVQRLADSGRSTDCLLYTSPSPRDRS